MQSKNYPKTIARNYIGAWSRAQLLEIRREWVERIKTIMSEQEIFKVCEVIDGIPVDMSIAGMLGRSNYICVAISTDNENNKDMVSVKPISGYDQGRYPAHYFIITDSDDDDVTRFISYSNMNEAILPLNVVYEGRVFPLILLLTINEALVADIIERHRMVFEESKQKYKEILEKISECKSKKEVIKCAPEAEIAYGYRGEYTLIDYKECDERRIMEKPESSNIDRLNNIPRMGDIIGDFASSKTNSNKG